MTKKKTVTLELSWEDAKALYAVQVNIGGDEEGPRGAFIRIGDALEKAGVPWPASADRGKFQVWVVGHHGLYFGKNYAPAGTKRGVIPQSLRPVEY